MTTTENVEPFQDFSFDTNFLKNEHIFRKIWSTVFLVESIYIGNATFPYKTALSETNAKKNRVRSTKWTYHKEQSFPSNYLLKNRVHLMYQPPKCPCLHVFVNTRVLFEGAFFSISILKWVQIT